MSRSVSQNAIIAASQVFVTGVVLFVLYRYLLREIGVAKIGVWSVVLAAVSASRVAQLGFSGSTIKFVAKYRSLKEPRTVSNIVQTATVSTAVFLAAMCFTFYPMLGWLLEQFMPEEGVADALALLPLALASLWLSAIAGIFQSALDGCQRIDIRGYLIMAGSFLYLGLAIVLVESHGLMGLVYAQILQGVFLLFAGWLALRWVLPELPRFPYQWRRVEFRETFSYGMNFQLVSLMQMLYEPVTKLLISNFGDLAQTGYYEMANRMVLQLRTLLVAGNQVLVPVIAEAHESSENRTVGIYRKSYGVVFFASTPFYCLTAGLVPFASEVWIGHFEPIFVLSANLLIVGWWINTLSAPAYFAFLGIGMLRWTVVGSVAIGLINVFLGYGLGVWLGGIGPILAWMIALCVGSLVMIAAYVGENSLRFRELVPPDSIPLFFASAIAAAIGFSVYRSIDSAAMGVAMVGLTFTALVLPFLLFHPYGKALAGYLRNMAGGRQR